jgi:N-acyl-D-glutamate deacylase
MNFNAKKLIAALSLSTITLTAGTACFAQSAYDLVIQGGRVIDPESGFDGVAHVGITGDQIAAISETPLQGKVVIDAYNQVVAPGFIDLHAHGQNIGAYRMYAMQGVTTALELESGVLPIADWYEAQAKKKLPVHYGASAAWTFARISAFEQTPPRADLDFFQEAQSKNEWKEDIASAEQLEEIFALIEQGLEEGGLGIGINAGYAPGHGQKEYYALAKLAAKHGVATYTHVRYMNMAEPQSTFEAMKELIGNSALTGAQMYICHINSNSLRDIDATLEMIDAAKAKGINIGAASYPWAAASTVVGAAMFTGDDWKQRTGYRSNSFQLGPRRLSDEELDRYQREAPGTVITWHFLDEENADELAILDKSILNPNVMIESDAVPWFVVEGDSITPYAGSEWPLPANVFSHPRSSGSYTKVLGSYVRERKLLSLNEAIRKMTLMPAEFMDDFVPQMKKKGRLQTGMDADIVVFDPATVGNRATYTEPTHYSVGVNTVVVAGSLVVQNGELILDAAPGQAIRR